MKVFRLILSVVILLVSLAGGVTGDNCRLLWWGVPLLTLSLFSAVGAYLVGMITLMNWNGVTRCIFR